MATLCIRITDEQMATAKEIARYRSLLDNKPVSVSALIRQGIDLVVSEKQLKQVEVEVIAIMHNKAQTKPHVKKR